MSGLPTTGKLEHVQADRQSALRKLWKEYCKACELRSQIWAAQDYTGTPPPDVPFPIELAGLTCGAKTRAGTPCKRRDLYASGRCKLHGGLSTGPRRELTP